MKLPEEGRPTLVPGASRNPVISKPLNAALAALLVCTLCRAGIQAQTADELKRDLDAMKNRVSELEDKTSKQEKQIDQLTAKRRDPAAGQPAGANAPAAREAEEKQPAETQEEQEERITENVLRKIQPGLAAANKTFPSQFNPAIGLFIDTAFTYGDNEHANFEFRAAELSLAASVDPFLKAYGIINGTEDGVEVEEAALVTTSLPWNLTVKGGRFFADFGRLSGFHDHDLPVVNRPVVLDRFIAGESQADGLEVSWLAPLDQYLTLTIGGYNKIGGENDRVDNGVARDISRFTFLARPATYFNITDSNSIDVGASYAITPRVDTLTVDGAGRIPDERARHLAGADITYRYTPLGESAYRGLIWGTEVLYNSEKWDLGDPGAPQFRRRDAWGLYSYLEVKLTRRFSPGFLFDYAQEMDRTSGETKAYSPYLTVWISEFNRFRFQYTYLDEPGNHENQVFVQWTAILGSHVHGFRDR